MVFVSHLAGTYGTLPGPGTAAPLPNASRFVLQAIFHSAANFSLSDWYLIKPLIRRIALLLLATAVVATACLSLVALELADHTSERSSLVQRMSDSFLFKTPTLKSLVGTFMTEQGASKADISVSTYWENILIFHYHIQDRRIPYG
jgi:hypothetical protein